MRFVFVIPAILFIAPVYGNAQDDPIHYTNPLSSDILNQPGLTDAQYDKLSLDEIWGSYVNWRSLILKPIPIANVANQAAYEYGTTVFRESELLFTMAELRAIIRQHGSDFATAMQRDELKRIDSVLDKMKIHYVQSDGFKDRLADYCDRVGPSQIAKSLKPIFYKSDGTPRPIPPQEFSR